MSQQYYGESSIIFLRKYKIHCYESLIKDTQPVCLFDICIIRAKGKDCALSVTIISAERFLTCKISERRHFDKLKKSSALLNKLC